MKVMLPKLYPVIVETQYAVLMMGETPSDVLAFKLIPKANIIIPNKYKINLLVFITAP
jgi:hydroxymethylpyrimidine/phosphomethylpyrimidine kinase